MQQAVCKNPWCKATFYFEEEQAPKTCFKCTGFEQTSGGVTWSDKKYDGPRFDGQPHQIQVNVDRSVDQKKYW